VLNSVVDRTAIATVRKITGVGDLSIKQEVKAITAISMGLKEDEHQAPILNLD
jgi:hypothetical protein